MKSLSFKVVLSAALIANTVFASGIPVVDGALNGQTTQQNIKQAAEWLKEAKRWVDTTKHYSSQLNAYAEQIAAQTGVRDVTSFLKDVKSVYDEAESLGENLYELKDFTKDVKGSLSSRVKSLMDKYYDYDYCANMSGEGEDADKSKNACYQNRALPIEEVAIYEKAGKNMQTRANNISKLKNKLAKSKDAKESADINNAIQAEVALMQADKIQIDLSLDAIKTKKEILREIKMGREIKRNNNLLPE